MGGNIVKSPYYEFFVLEKEMMLFSLEFQGINYWQLIRFGLLKKITTNNLHVVSNRGSRNLNKEIVGVFKEAARMKREFTKDSSADIIQLRPCVTILDNGQLDDHQFDYIELKDKYRVVDLYALGDYMYVQPCVEYDMALAEKDLVIWKIKRKIFGEPTIPEEQQKVLRAFLTQINQIYNTHFMIEELLPNIQYIIKSHIIYKRNYLKLFQKLCPKIIMEYPHYDEHMFAANAAAKELGIKIIEMQHGRINAHEGYWYEDQSLEGKILPDYFLTYGQWWKDQINLPQFCKVEVVGNPYLDRQIELYPRKKRDNMVLSVFSNPQNGKVLSEFIFSIQNYCIEHNIKILYKLHPNEKKVWKEEYPLLLQMKNTTIFESGSVYSILAESDAAIGINSTVFFEALAYKDIRLFIYTNGEYEGMKPLIENDMAITIDTSDDFIRHLDNLKNTKVQKNEIGNTMWENNAKKNTENKIMELMRN